MWAITWNLCSASEQMTRCLTQIKENILHRDTTNKYNTLTHSLTHTLRCGSPQYCCASDFEEQRRHYCMVCRRVRECINASRQRIRVIVLPNFPFAHQIIKATWFIFEYTNNSHTHTHKTCTNSIVSCCHCLAFGFHTFSSDGCCSLLMMMIIIMCAWRTEPTSTAFAKCAHTP